MGNGTSNNSTWTSTQAYVLAVICLLIGVGAGYFLRGSASPDATATQQAGAPAGMGGGMMGGMPGGQPTPEQLKRMADKQAEPLLAQLKSNPKDAKLLSQLGNIYYDTQQYPIAVQYYEQSLQIEPQNPNVRTDMGTAYYYMGDPDRALKEFETALKYDPKHSHSMFNMGMVRWQGKMDVPGALNAWETLLKTTPDYPDRAKVEQLIAQVKQHQNIKPGQKTDKPATPANM